MIFPSLYKYIKRQSILTGDIMRKSKPGYHWHHVIPKHMGGSDDSSNLVELTVEEHAAAHLKLYEEHGNKFDRIAYLVLSKQIGYEEANYLKLLGPKKWSEEGKQTLREAGRNRTGDKNPFFGKTHSEESKKLQRENNKNNWIRGIDPANLPYTKQYQITYPNGDSKIVAGLKIISNEFNVSIPNIYNAIKRMTKGKIPTRGALSGILIKEVSK